MPIVSIHSAELAIFSLSGDTRNPRPNIEFDLNAFRDPLGNLTLRKECTDGADPKVQEWIKVDPRFEPILNQCIILVKDYFHANNYSWFSIGFRDHHGTWKSRAVASLIAAELSNLGYKVGLMHTTGGD